MLSGINFNTQQPVSRKIVLEPEGGEEEEPKSQNLRITAEKMVTTSPGRSQEFKFYNQQTSFMQMEHQSKPNNT